MLQGVSHRFDHALVRTPADSVVRGLSNAGLGAPDPAIFREEHALYVAALERLGLAVEILPPLEAYPDSVFVEDTACCLPEGAVLLRPGAPSRRGEAEALEPALRRHYGDLSTLSAGHIDGGDVLVTERGILVGDSGRTDEAGFAAFRDAVARWGYEARRAAVPSGVLHFKTACGLLDEETILATARLAEAECLRPFRVLRTPGGEETAANTVLINGVVLLSTGFPRTAEMLDKAGYPLEIVPSFQAARVDGGLSCLSLRFRRP